MPGLTKIVLPVDFSDRAAGPARYARALAARCRSEVILLHVIPPLYTDFGPDLAGAMLVDVYRTRAENIERSLNGFLIDELAGVTTRRVVLHGDPASEIVRFSHEESAGLIVMPTHGYGPFRRFILGSTTAKVLHDADCPVWTGVHLADHPTGQAAQAPVEIRHVLCAVDLGEHSGRTIAWAGWLQAQFGARLTLAHAVAAHGDSLGIIDAAREELTRMLPGADAGLLLEAGEPARVICGMAAKVSADVVVIGRGSSAGHFGRLRTHSYAIIRQSPCPVASV